MWEEGVGFWVYAHEEATADVRAWPRVMWDEGLGSWFYAHEEATAELLHETRVV
jgi:hypothetical protein